jgi:hypothetical protein
MPTRRRIWSPPACFSLNGRFGGAPVTLQHGANTVIPASGCQTGAACHGSSQQQKLHQCLSHWAETQPRRRPLQYAAIPVADGWSEMA